MVYADTFLIWKNMVRFYSKGTSNYMKNNQRVLR